MFSVAWAAEAAVLVLPPAMDVGCSNTLGVKAAEGSFAAVEAVVGCMNVEEMAADTSGGSALAWAYTSLLWDSTPLIVVPRPLWTVGSRRQPWFPSHFIPTDTLFNSACR